MPEIIQLGLSDAIAKAAKENAAIVDALPSNEASVSATKDGVTVMAGADVGAHATVGGWWSRQWQRASDFGVAMRWRWGK